MSKKYTLGVDFGTLSGRAVIADTSDGRELASCTAEYAHAVIDEYLPSSGEKLPASWALEDPRDFLDTLKTVIPGVIREAGIDPRDIIGVGMDFTCSTFLPIRKDGTPLCFEDRFAKEKHAYCKLWKHHGAQKYADKINEIYKKRGDTWMDGNFSGKMSGEFFLPKVWETVECAPDVYRESDLFIEAADWVNFQLTGRLNRGYVISSIKECYHKADGTYVPKDFLEALNPSLSDLFEKKFAGDIVMPGKACGYVTKEASAIYGLPEGIPVAASMPDAHVGGLAIGLKNAGDMFGIFGTSNCYFLMSREYVQVPGIMGCVPDGIMPGYFSYESGLSCFGDHFAWAAEKICPADYAEEAKSLGISNLQLLIKKAAALNPGESGLLALDWWNGNRNILVNSELTGMLIGMSLQTKPEHIMRALIEATAFGTRIILDNFREHGIDINRFIAAGGVPRKDPFTMQLFSDVLGMPIEVSSTKQAGALGDAIHAAAVAGKAAGGYDSIDEAVEAMKVPVCAEYRPCAEAHKVYSKLYDEYRRLHDYFGRGENDVMAKLRQIHG